MRPSSIRAGTIFSCLFLVWLILNISVTEVALASRMILQGCIGGVSFFKQHLFLGTGLLFSLCIFYWRGADRVARLDRHIFLGILTVAYLLSLCCTVYLTWAYDLPLASQIIAIVDGRNSTHLLIHSHAAKGVMAWGMELLGYSPLLSFADTGYAMYRLVPRALTVLVAIALCGSLVMSLRCVARGAIDWNGSDAAGRFMLYLINAYGLLKGCVDGGPFSAQVLAAASGFYLILTNAPFLNWRTWSRWGAMSLLSALPLMISLEFASSTFDWYYFSRDILLYIASCGVFYFPLTTIAHSSGLVGPGTFLSGIAFIGLSYTYYIRYELQYWFTSLTPGTEMIFMQRRSDLPKDSPLLAVREEGAYALYRTTAGTASSILRFMQSQKIPVYYRYARRVGSDCNPEALGHLKGQIVAVEGALSLPLAPPPHGAMLSSFEVSACAVSEPCSYNYSTSYNECLSDVLLTVVPDFLHARGLRKFFLIPEPKQTR